METINEYDKQAEDFLTKTGTTFKAIFNRMGKHFPGDAQARSIWDIVLQNERYTYSFTFGQSIAAGKEEPRPYSVLACLEKYEVSELADFLEEFGYLESGEAAKRGIEIHPRVVEEYENVCKLWTEEEIEELQEIQ